MRAPGDPPQEDWKLPVQDGSRIFKELASLARCKKKKNEKQPSLRAKKILFGDFIAGSEPGLAPQTGWKGHHPHDPGLDEAISSRPSLSSAGPPTSQEAGRPAPRGFTCPWLSEAGAERGAYLDPLFRCDLSL